MIGSYLLWLALIENAKSHMPHFQGVYFRVNFCQ